jgi:predicted RNase H-like nuclease
LISVGILSRSVKYVGVGGCPDGWLVVEYREATFRGAEQYDDIEATRDAHDDAESVLIDVPIGLRETENTPRPCDAVARRVLGSPRSSGVFPTPVRPVLQADSYEAARRIREDKTGGSLGAQTWGISTKIRALDEFMLSNQAGVVGTIQWDPPVLWVRRAFAASV